MSCWNESIDCKDCAGYYPQDIKGQIKCCAYSPFLANFLVGQIIRSFEKDLSFFDGYITPLGVVPYRIGIKNYRIYRKYVEDISSLKCQFYENKGGKCKIWPFHGSVCSSFICKSQYPQGIRYSIARKNFLWELELTQAQMLVIDLGFSENDLKRSLALLNGEKIEKTKWSLDIDSSFFERAMENKKNYSIVDCLSMNKKLKKLYENLLEREHKIKFRKEDL